MTGMFSSVVPIYTENILTKKQIKQESQLKGRRGPGETLDRPRECSGLPPCIEGALNRFPAFLLLIVVNLLPFHKRCMV